MGIAFSGTASFLKRWTDAYGKGIAKDDLLSFGNKIYSNDVINQIGENGLPAGNLFQSTFLELDRRIANSPKLLKKLGGAEQKNAEDGTSYTPLGGMARAKSLFYHAYGKDAGELSYKRVAAAGIAGSYLAYRALS